MAVWVQAEVISTTEKNPGALGTWLMQTACQPGTDTVEEPEGWNPKKEKKETPLEWGELKTFTREVPTLILGC